MYKPQGVRCAEKSQGNPQGNTNEPLKQLIFLFYNTQIETIRLGNGQTARAQNRETRSK